MISKAIEAALKADCFSHVIVSTDCPEIAEVSKKYGAEVPFLRDHYADDHSTVSEATYWTVKKLEEELGIKPNFIVQMMANVPLKRPETIIQFVEELEKDDECSLISCFEPKFSPPHWAIEKKKDGTGHFPLTQFLSQRSKDLPELLIPTGAIWGAKWDYLKKHQRFYGPKFRIFEMDWVEALDIDTPEELKICKILASYTKC